MILSEGRWDKLTGKISRAMISAVKNKERKLSIPFKIKNKDAKFVIEFEYVDKLAYPLTFVAGTLKGLSVFSIKVNSALLPQSLEYLSIKFQDIVRHEIEHLTQNLISGKNVPHVVQKDVSLKDYLLFPREIPAYVQGRYQIAKAQKIPLDSTIDIFLQYLNLTQKEKEEIKQTWIKWAKKNLTSAVWSENMNKFMDLLKETLGPKSLESLKDILKDTKVLYIKTDNKNIKPQYKFKTDKNILILNDKTKLNLDNVTNWNIVGDAKSKQISIEF